MSPIFWFGFKNVLSAVNHQPRSPRNLTRRESSSCLARVFVMLFKPDQAARSRPERCLSTFWSNPENVLFHDDLDLTKTHRKQIFWNISPIQNHSPLKVVQSRNLKRQNELVHLELWRFFDPKSVSAFSSSLKQNRIWRIKNYSSNYSSSVESSNDS